MDKQIVLEICVHVYAQEYGYVHVHACMHVALLIQHATHMRHTVTSFVAPLAPPYFLTLFHKWNNFRKKNVTEHKMCDLIFYITFV
jgi:hypothetical protein